MPKKKKRVGWLRKCDNRELKGRNENGKNAIGLHWQNNNFTRALRIFVHFFAFPTQVCRIEKDTVKAINATISPWSRTRSPLFSYKLLSLLSSNWVTWHEGEKVWNDFNSIFQWPLHWRCRCQIVRSLMKSSPSTLPPTHRMPQPRFKGIGSSRPWRGRGTRLPTHLPNPP